MLNGKVEHALARLVVEGAHFDSIEVSSGGEYRVAYIGGGEITLRGAKEDLETIMRACGALAGESGGYHVPPEVAELLKNAADQP